MDDKDKCRDTEDYMEKSLRFCVAKCLTKKYTYATPSSLETIQNLAIQCKKKSSSTIS